MPDPYIVFHTPAGQPCASCTLTFKAAGTDTLQDTFSDYALTVPNLNPLTLNSAGQNPAGAIYWSPKTYKVTLKSALGSTIWERDLVPATPPFFVNLDITGTAGEALSAGDVVFLANGSGGTTAGRWHKADADTAGFSSTALYIGMTPSACALGATNCTIRTSGRVTGLTGLSVGTTYYVSGTAGALTSSLPALVRTVGVADSTTTLVLTPNSLASGVVVGGGLNVLGAFNATGAAALNSGLTVTGAATVSTTLGVTGAVTGASFSGVGTALTALNASNLGSGTVPDARFPATLPAVSGANLTNLPAGNLSGTITAATQQLISKTSGDVLVGNGHHHRSGSSTLANGATVTIGPYTGAILVTRNNDWGAWFMARAAGPDVAETSDPGSQYDTTMGAGAINLYWTGGNLELQNNTGASATFYWTLLATN
jgi:hypothetical protein